VYHLGCLRPIDPKCIYFINDAVSAPGDNFLPLMERLTAEKYRCVFFGKVLQESRVRYYLRRTFFYLGYARARAVYLMEVCPLVEGCRPRKGTDIIQLWHGCGAFKKFGYSCVDLAWGPSEKAWKWNPVHQYYKYACVSAPEIIPHYVDAFRCPEEILRPWGAPRTDYFFRPGVTEGCRRQILEAFPEIGARKIVLYAPTFRGNKLRKARHDDVLDYDLMAEQLGGDCVLLLKPHPRSRTNIPTPEPGQIPFVFDAIDQRIETLLCAADLCISDYSSLVFEYSLLERPMLFFSYDLEKYEKSRSFYYPYLQFVPGALVWDTEDVIAGIRRNLFEGGFDSAKVQAFRKKFMSACDGHSTERILRNTLGL
jgi:CDP-ribitol ribitolphosphotransferase